jgi:hypothetical protein
LMLDDGSGPFTVVDNDPALDQNPVPGQVTYIGPSGLWLNVTTGSTKPATGAPALPYVTLALDSLNFQLGNVGASSPLTISFSDNFFGPGDGNFLLDVGGTLEGTGGTATFSAWADPGNGLFGTTIPLGSFGPFPAAAFSSSSSASVGSLAAPYSLTLSAVLTGQGPTSFGFRVAGVPDAGASLGLLLLGLSPLAFFACLRKTA